MSTHTGIFTPNEAVRENYTHSLNIATKLRDYLRTDLPVIDFGCGDCYYISFLHNGRHFKVFGFDGRMPDETFSAGTNIVWGIDLAFRQDPIWGLEEKSLRGQVLCLEVGEHIPKEYEQTFIDNICRHCNSTLILSWAVPGQNGINHVNCQPNTYIIQQIEKRGFVFLDAATDYFRNDVEQHISYFKNTLMVFDKIKI